jgi:hypothetical protein
MSNLVVMDGSGAAADKKIKEREIKSAKLRAKIGNLERLMEDERRAEARFKEIEDAIEYMVDNRMDGWKALLPELDQVGDIMREARVRVFKTNAKERAEEAREKLKKLKKHDFKPEMESMEEGDETAEEGSGSFLSTARDAKIAPMPRVSIIDMGESDDESIPDEEIPATFEIPDAYTRPPTLAIESRNDEDASFYSINGLEEDSFHTVALGKGAAFSRKSSVAPRHQTDPQQQTSQDDRGASAADDAQTDMMVLPDTFDIDDTPDDTPDDEEGSYDSYQNYLQRRDDVEGGRQTGPFPFSRRRIFPYFLGR